MATTTTLDRLSGRSVRLGWLLAATTFVGVVAVPGCSAFNFRRSAPATVTRSPDEDGWRSSSADATTPVTQTPRNGTPDDNAPQSDARADRDPFGANTGVDDTDVFAEPEPQVVNVFGELDGVERGPVRPVGDAGFQQHTFADEGFDTDVAVDPTGKWLVFASTRHNEHADIYLQRVDGTSVTQLTSDASDDAYPVFSPDGSQIAFCSTRAGNWQIYLMDTDGRNVVQVTSGQMQAVHPSFSPDGTRVVYAALGAKSKQWELWTANLSTNEKRMIGYGLFPTWSPDRTVDRIAYQRARQRGSRWFSLWTLDLIDGEGRRMTEVAVSTNAAIVSPSWSPDGKRLAFATVVHPAKGSGRSGGQQDVWTISADGTNRQRLTDGNGTNLMPFWGTDSRVYFISDRGGTECVWSTRTDGVKTFTASAEKQNGKNAGQAKPQPEAIGSTDTSSATE